MLTREELQIIAGGILANVGRTPGPYLPGAYGTNDGKIYDWNEALVADCGGHENNAGYLSHAANNLPKLLKHAEEQAVEIHRLEEKIRNLHSELTAEKLWSL